MKLKSLRRIPKAPFNRRSAYNKLKKFHSKKRSIDEIIDMGMNFKTNGLYRVDSVQKRVEILSLIKAVAAINPKSNI